MSLLTKSNIKEHCRTCLKQLNDSTESSISGFNPDEVQDSKDLYFNICNDPELQQLISINIDGPCTSDVLPPIVHNFPENICLACYNKLYSFAVFRRKAQQSAKKLRTLLNSNDDIKVDLSLELCENEPKIDEFELHATTAKHGEIFFETPVDHIVDVELNKETANPFSISAPPIPDGRDDEVKGREKRTLRSTGCSKETKNTLQSKCSKGIKKTKYVKSTVGLEHCENESKKDENLLHDATTENRDTSVYNIADAEIGEDTINPFSPSAPSISDCSDYEIEVKEKLKLCKTKCSKKKKNIRESKCVKDIKTDKYRCPQCNLNFAKNSELSDHVNKEHARGTCPFLCDYCTSSYRRLRNLKDHIVQRHQDKIKEREHFQCTECPKAYLDKLAVRRHIRLHFIDKKTRICGICSEGFPAKKWLIDHLRTHTADGRLPCARCDKTYCHYEDLENHERSAHLKEKPYHCQICDKSFQTKQSFRMHKYRHAGNKRFLCDICGKDFCQGTAMKKHRLSHFKTHLKKQK